MVLKSVMWKNLHTLQLLGKTFMLSLQTRVVSSTVNLILYMANIREIVNNSCCIWLVSSVSFFLCMEYKQLDIINVSKTTSSAHIYLLYRPMSNFQKLSQALLLASNLCTNKFKTLLAMQQKSIYSEVSIWILLFAFFSETYTNLC